MRLHEIITESDTPMTIDTALSVWARTEGKRASSFISGNIQARAREFAGNGLEPADAVNAAHNSLEREEQALIAKRDQKNNKPTPPAPSKTAPQKPSRPQYVGAPQTGNQMKMPSLGGASNQLSDLLKGVSSRLNRGASMADTFTLAKKK